MHWYAKTMDMAGTPASVTLYNMANAHQALRVLEIGPGIGSASQAFAKSLMQKGQVYYVVDIQAKIIDKNVKDMEESDFKLNPNNEVLRVTKDDALVEPEEGKKKVVYLESDAREIPLPDESFDAIIASFLCASPDTVFAQYSRLLKKGGRLAISLKGRFDSTDLLKESSQSVKELDIAHPQCELKEVKSFEPILELAKQHGFSHGKAFFLPLPTTIDNGEDAWKLVSKFEHILNGFSEEEFQKTREIFIQKFDEKYGPETTDFYANEAAIFMFEKL